MHIGRKGTLERGIKPEIVRSKKRPAENYHCKTRGDIGKTKKAWYRRECEKSPPPSSQFGMKLRQHAPKFGENCRR